MARETGDTAFHEEKGLEGEAPKPMRAAAACSAAPGFFFSRLDDWTGRGKRGGSGVCCVCVRAPSRPAVDGVERVWCVGDAVPRLSLPWRRGSAFHWHGTVPGAFGLLAAAVLQLLQASIVGDSEGRHEHGNLDCRVP
ncbi:unnamed protein product [Urochloa humidicola]